MEKRIKYLNHIEFAKLVPETYDTVLLPVGTMEAHGVIPIGTDILIPEAMAERIADEVDLLVAPTIPYGITHSLYDHPGGVTITDEVFEAYVYDVVESLANTGFEKVIVLNGHGGQINELQKTLYEANRDLGVIEKEAAMVAKADKPDEPVGTEPITEQAAIGLKRVAAATVELDLQYDPPFSACDPRQFGEEVGDMGNPISCVAVDRSEGVIREGQCLIVVVLDQPIIEPQRVRLGEQGRLHIRPDIDPVRRFFHDLRLGGRVGKIDLISETSSLPAEGNFTFHVEQNPGYIVIPIYQGNRLIKEIRVDIDSSLP